MKKQRVSPTTNLSPSVFKTSGELPTLEAVNKAVAEVTGQTEVVQKVKEVSIEKQKPILAKATKVEKVQNISKRETLKGTILQAVMVEKELLKKVKRKAFDDEISLSEVFNDALKQYFQ